MQIDQSRIEQAIIEQAVGELVDSDGLRGLVATTVERRIDILFKETANKQIEAAISQAIRDGFERPYHKIDTFGRPSGEPTTIAAELERQISGYWNQMVDKNGKPSDSSYGCVKRAEYVISQMVASDFAGDMKQHMVNIGASFKDRLRGELQDTLNKLLSEIFHVCSLGDQELKKPGRSFIDPSATKS